MGKARIIAIILSFICVSARSQHQDTLTGASSGNLVSPPVVKDTSGSNDQLYRQIDKDFKAALAKVNAGAAGKKTAPTQKGSGGLASLVTNPSNLKIGAVDS